MIWFYHRGSETLSIETRYNSSSGAYELIWHHPDGSHTVESFPSEALFRQRSQSVEASLSNEEWNLSGSPTFLPDGWQPE
ncbi:MAG: hypothetical protein OEW19_15265 [Acidobacteriota bacterium]|jgi:hypothetical protein|nr:hypothetical protein [Acidobacteriota bacterium]